MSVTAKMFGKFFLSTMNKELDLNSDAIKCALITAAHAPDQDVDQYWDAAHGMIEVGNSGTYAAGGAACGTPTIAYDAGTNVMNFDCDNIQWTGATITARYAIFYDSTPAANKPLIGYVDFGADVSCTNGTFDLTIATGGVFAITVA